MPQPNDLSRSLVALDQNSTIIAVLEMSQSSWLVAGMLPGIEREMPRSGLCLYEHKSSRLRSGMVKKWGLGFMISTEPVLGGRSAGSLAWAGLGNTYFWIDLDRGIAGVILMQLPPSVDPKALAFLDQFEKSVYASLPQ